MYKAVFIVLLACSIGLADSPFTFPTEPLPVVPPVTPPPKPGAMPVLTPGVWYIVESKVDAIPRVHPAILAKVTKETGPQTIKGVFIDGNGKVETRKFTAPYLFFVEPTGVGVVEVDFIPIKDKLVEADIGFRSIQVNNGQAPIPPPDPPPSPVDTLKTFSVIFVYESGVNLPVEQRAVIYGADVEKWLVANCTAGKNGFRRYDKDNPGDQDPVMKPLWATVKPAVTIVPCVAMERNSKIEIVNLDPTQAAMIATFTKYRGK